MEFKKRPEYFNFYLLEDISESSYSSLKKEVLEKIAEIRKIDIENKQYGKVLGIDIEALRTPVRFIFHISTYGGHVYDGLGICDFLRRLDEEDNGIEVTVICEGKIMSMGIPIICSVRNRVSTPHTSFMIHSVSSIALGKLEDLQEDVEEVKRLWEECKKIIVENTKITIQELEEWSKCRRDVFFDAKKALEYGLINDII